MADAYRSVTVRLNLQVDDSALSSIDSSRLERRLSEIGSRLDQLPKRLTKGIEDSLAGLGRSREAEQLVNAATAAVDKLRESTKRLEGAAKTTSDALGGLGTATRRNAEAQERDLSRQVDKLGELAKAAMDAEAALLKAGAAAGAAGLAPGQQHGSWARPTTPSGWAPGMPGAMSQTYRFRNYASTDLLTGGRELGPGTLAVQQQYEATRARHRQAIETERWQFQASGLMNGRSGTDVATRRAYEQMMGGKTWGFSSAAAGIQRGAYRGPAGQELSGFTGDPELALSLARRDERVLRQVQESGQYRENTSSRRSGLWRNATVDGRNVVMQAEDYRDLKNRGSRYYNRASVDEALRGNARVQDQLSRDIIEREVDRDKAGKSKLYAIKRSGVGAGVESVNTWYKDPDIWEPALTEKEENRRRAAYGRDIQAREDGRFALAGNRGGPSTAAYDKLADRMGSAGAANQAILSGQQLTAMATGSAKAETAAGKLGNALTKIKPAAVQAGQAFAAASSAVAHFSIASNDTFSPVERLTNGIFGVIQAGRSVGSIISIFTQLGVSMGAVAAVAAPLAIGLGALLYWRNKNNEALKEGERLAAAADEKNLARLENQISKEQILLGLKRSIHETDKDTYNRVRDLQASVRPYAKNDREEIENRRKRGAQLQGELGQIDLSMQAANQRQVNVDYEKREALRKVKKGLDSGDIDIAEADKRKKEIENKFVRDSRAVAERQQELVQQRARIQGDIRENTAEGYAATARVAGGRKEAAAGLRDMILAMRDRREQMLESSSGRAEFNRQLLTGDRGDNGYTRSEQRQIDAYVQANRENLGNLTGGESVEQLDQAVQEAERKLEEIQRRAAEHQQAIVDEMSKTVQLQGEFTNYLSRLTAAQQINVGTTAELNDRIVELEGKAKAIRESAAKRTGQRTVTKNFSQGRA